MTNGGITFSYQDAFCGGALFTIDHQYTPFLDPPDFRRGEEKMVAPTGQTPDGGNGRNVVSRSGSFKKDEARFHATVRCSSPMFVSGCLKSSAPSLPRRTFNQRSYSLGLYPASQCTAI